MTLGQVKKFTKFLLICSTESREAQHLKAKKHKLKFSGRTLVTNSETLVGLTWIFMFHHAAQLPSCPAASAKFPSEQAGLGRQWNTCQQVNPTQISEQMKHPV